MKKLKSILKNEKSTLKKNVRWDLRHNTSKYFYKKLSVISVSVFRKTAKKTG